MSTARGGRVVWLAVLVGAGYMLPLYLTGALSVLIRDDLGLSAPEFGAVVSAFFAVGGVLMPFGGRIVDRVGAAAAVRLAIAGAVLCLGLAAAFGGTATGLTLALVVGGVGTAVAGPVGGMLIARGVPPRAAPRAFALERSSIPAATLVAGLAVPTLAVVLHWRAVFLCAAVAVAAIALVPVPGLSPPVARKHGGSLRPLGPLLVMTAVFFLGSAAATSMSAFLVGYGVSLGETAGLAGVVLAVASAGTIGARLLLGFQRGRTPGRGTLVGFLLLGAAGFALLAVPAEWALWSGALLAGAAGWGWTGVAGHAVVSAYASAPGSATAAVQAGGCLGGVAGPLLMGWLTDGGTYAGGWLALGGLLVLSASGAALNRRMWASSHVPVVVALDPRDPACLTSERNSVRLNGTASAVSEAGKGGPVTNGPLTGVRVLDVSTILAGPLCARILGDHGADVVKIEHPVAGDGMRGHGQVKDGTPLWWKEISRNKRHIGLNLSTPDGAALLLRLAAEADVLVENFRPGTLERWGIGPQRLHEANPGLIVVRVTGFGQTGPYAARAGFGTLAEAMSGFAHMTGEADGPPTLPAFGLADSICGITASSAVAMALYARDRNGGKGDVIDINLLEPIMTAVGPGPMVYDQLGVVGHRHGNRSTNNAPRNTYRTKDDRWVAISTSAQRIAERVLTLVGHPEVIEEPWFASGHGRAAHADLLDAHVGGWIADRTEAEVAAAFAEAGAAVAPVYSARDLVEDEHVTATGMLTRVEDPDFGDLLMHNVLWRSASTPGGIRFTGRALGADTDDVLGGLGLDQSEVDDLRTRGVVA
ncbi:MFS transporter [Lentzea sp. NPDC058450]|uniref:MFS transporter n=1 Tax=Lentzea sp. NPDC058450 TaxID=3346505 RepID=UPI003647E52B